MNVEKEVKKTIFEPLYSPAIEANGSLGTASKSMEYWVEGGKPCPKCGSFHTQKNAAICLTTYPCQYHFRCVSCSHTWTDYEYFDKGLTYQPQPGDFNPHKEYGWICPKCGRVYSPSTSQCFHCGGGFSPNIVYCGPNNGTRDILDTITISNTTNSSNNATIADMAKNAVHEELQNSIKNSTK